MKIIVLGTRGIPKIQGGVETHCENLYPRLAALGCDIIIFRRSPYIKEKNFIKKYKGVNLCDLYAPRKKSLEAVFHTLVGIIAARKYKPDILHIHAIGPSLLVPLARLLGIKVVVTHHGPDYNREKWGILAKTMLKLGERVGVKFANRVIVISEVIKNLLEQKYNTNGKLELIYNGVSIPQKDRNLKHLSQFNLESLNYIIAVGRLVPEKGFHDLIAAYQKLNTNIKLVLVGDADHKTGYSKKLKQTANEAGIILTGFIQGKKLRQMLSHAKLFILPSYHEGLPIALLEAMSYNLDVLISDIPANREIKLNAEDYFKVGNIDDLHKKLQIKIEKTDNRRNFSGIIKTKYNWDTIAKQVFNLYSSVSNEKLSGSNLAYPKSFLNRIIRNNIPASSK